MADAFIVRRGGGGGTKLFAAIGVTYPQGSKCECTNGTKTLKAKSTDGQWVFAVPSEGEWMVRCYDGDDFASSANKKESEKIVITAEGQFASVELTYQLVLFANGTVNSATGGFDGKGTYGDYGGANYNLSGTNLSLSVNSGYGSSAVYISTKNAIDVTKFNAICFDVKSLTKQGDGRFSVGLAESFLNNNYSVSASPSEAGVVRIDVSELQGLFYPAIYGFGRYEQAWETRGSVAADISKIWLE